MRQDPSVAMVRRVSRLKEEALALSREGESFPAVWRNSLRILACVRMLELDLGLDRNREDPISVTE